MTEPRARAILEGLKVAYPDLADLTSDLVAEADRGNAEARKAVEARIALNRAVERAWKTVPAGLPC
jgi:hypothetical protein